MLLNIHNKQCRYVIECSIIFIQKYKVPSLQIIFLFIHYNHDDDVAPPGRISLTLSRHLSLSFVAPVWSSRLHPVSAQSCCIKVLAGRPAFARPFEGVHRSMSLMSSSLLHQQYPTGLVHFTWIVFVICGRWP